MESKFNILVAEDDPASRKLLERLLDKSDYNITSVENGRQALEALNTHSFHIVLTDWMMPELDGIGLCRTIRKTVVSDNYVYIILLTAKNSRDDILIGLDAGADDYLIKPFNPGELIARINTGVRILNLEMARQEAEQQIRRYSEGLEEMVRERTEQLRHSEEKYRTIIENIEDGYYELNLEGRLTFFNDSALRFGGYSKEELLRMNFSDFITEESTQELFETYNNTYKTGVPVKRVYWLMKTKSGQVRNMDSSISLICDSEGKPCGFRGIVRDVTEQKRLEAELMEKRRLAESANLAKSEFLANISHEIRTPLNGIIGMAELVMETQLEAHQKELIQVIESETSSLAELINQILDFSKIEARKMTIEKVPFDLRNTLDDLTRIMTLRTERKGLTFHCSIASDVPSRLSGDPGKLRQILMNLLTNALKFTHTGRIELTVTLEQLHQKQAKLRFAIKDTGIGIASEKKNLIFEPFTQADGSTTRKYGGTGLGTTISKHLTQLMGGDMGFDSESGKGSIFWFTVVMELHTADRPIPAKITVDLSARRILLVNASMSTMANLTPHFNSWGLRFKAFSSGKEALAEIERSRKDQDPFELMIIGSLTSDLDGFELAQIIRKSAPSGQCPILMLVPVGNPGDARICRQIGIDGYLTGAIEPESLRTAIMMVLARYREKDLAGEEALITRHSLCEVQRSDIRILLVEDYPTNQLLAMRHLRNAGYSVDLAENGREAIEAFQRERYDLILMDMQMPIMDGYAATKAIRAMEAENSRTEDKDTVMNPVPIIATTAHAMKGDRELCIASGVNDYLTKPLRKAKLLGTVDKWITGIDRTEPPPPQAETARESTLCTSVPADCSAAVENQPVDFERAVAEFEGDEEFLLEVLKGFLINVNLQIEMLRKALTENDAEVIRKEAHSIKGGAAELAALHFSKLAFELEKMGTAAALGEGATVIDRLEEEYHRIVKYADLKYPCRFADL